MVRMRIRSWSGAEWDGVLLRLRGLEMRVAVSGYGDAAEFQCRSGQWVAENGDPVQMVIDTPAPERYGSCAAPLDGRAKSLGCDASLRLN